MGKITKPKRNSLKWSFFIYIPVCFFISLAGSYFIGISTNHLQDWYTSKHNNAALRPSNEYYTDNNSSYFKGNSNISNSAGSYLSNIKSNDSLSSSVKTTSLNSATLSKISNLFI